jgi:hypothetical protein
VATEKRGRRCTKWYENNNSLSQCMHLFKRFFTHTSTAN